MTGPKPAYIEVAPNRFTPVELCTSDELTAAASHRLLEARDLLEQIGGLLARAQHLRARHKD